MARAARGGAIAGGGARATSPRAHWLLRSLGWFWALLFVAGAGGAAALRFTAPGGVPTATSAAGVEPDGAVLAATPPPRRDTAAGEIAPPDPALMEPAAGYPGLSLPRIGADRRSPMLAYAARVDAAEKRPRISVLLAGMGMSANDSEAAVKFLPPAVSLAISPYAFRPAGLLDMARARGHELFVSIPMEPQGYPLADAGGQVLLTGNAESLNRQRLGWALSRFAGYVGATAALGPDLRGERFEAEAAAIAPILDELAQRGLMFVDTRIGYGKPQAAVGRGIDIVLDDPAPIRADIEAKLTRLEQIAHDRGSAVGLMSAPRPTAVATLAAWAATLDARGLALVPVSAVAPIIPPK